MLNCRNANIVEANSFAIFHRKLQETWATMSSVTAWIFRAYRPLLQANNLIAVIRFCITWFLDDSSHFGFVQDQLIRFLHSVLYYRAIPRPLQNASLTVTTVNVSNRPLLSGTWTFYGYPILAGQKRPQITSDSNGFKTWGSVYKIWIQKPFISTGINKV